MPLTPAEIETRRKFVTATDIPRLFGVAPPAWGNAADVYLCKVCEGMDPFDANKAMEAGNYLEPSVGAWADQQLGGIRKGSFRVHSDGLVAATLDYETKIAQPVECKTHGIVGYPNNVRWGDPGTDQIPDYYLLQVHAQILVTGADKAYVPALIGGRGFVMYEVFRNDKICGVIQAKAEAFWTNHVEKQIPPGDVIPQIETLKRIRREPKKTTVILDELALEKVWADECLKAAKARQKRANEAIISSLGDAEAAQCSLGTFTYYEQTRSAYETEDATFRVFRRKKGDGWNSAPAWLDELERRMNHVEAILHGAGYKIRHQSDARSRYYCGIDRPEIRVADHPANEATERWMQRESVREVRVDEADFESQAIVATTTPYRKRLT